MQSHTYQLEMQHLLAQSAALGARCTHTKQNILSNDGVGAGAALFQR